MECCFFCNTNKCGIEDKENSDGSFNVGNKILLTKFVSKYQFSTCARSLLPFLGQQYYKQSCSNVFCWGKFLFIANTAKIAEYIGEVKNTGSEDRILIQILLWSWLESASTKLWIPLTEIKMESWLKRNEDRSYLYKAHWSFCTDAGS